MYLQIYNQYVQISRKSHHYYSLEFATKTDIELYPDSLFTPTIVCQAKNVEEINAVLEDARKQLSERINSEMELAEDRRNKQLGDLLDRIKEHVCPIIISHHILFSVLCG